LQVKFMAGGTEHLIDRVGCMRPKIEQLAELGPGEIGFITAQIKEVAQARVGDTITTVKGGATEALPGFKEVQPVVFCGLFPVDAADFEKLRDSIGKLRLNDASFSFEMETSAALGFGFRCGFLGLLHLEIIQERLSREYDLDLITTAPSVVYRLTMTDGDGRTAQPGRHARRGQDRHHGRAVDQGDDLHARRISGLDPQAVPGPPRHPDRADLCRRARAGEL
jgi:GTP-binding protein LepA